MVRTNNKSSTVPVASSSAAAVPVQNAAVSDSTKKSKKPKSAVSAPVSASVSSPVETVSPADTVSPVENVVVSNVDAVDGVNSPITQKLSEFSAKLQQVAGVISTLKTEYRVLEKAIQRELKANQKTSAKKARRAGNRTPSGFVKPTLISNELAVFLGKEPGTELARTAVSKEINQYIRDNNLQDKENGRKINPDAKLSALLKFSPGDVLTYFNLQRYMKHHFRKAEPVAVVATA